MFNSHLIPMKLKSKIEINYFCFFFQYSSKTDTPIQYPPSALYTLSQKAHLLPFHIE